jgi:2-polyprenyl-6-methoxyphenol hydroxylase-like FAD-dependent oxidoreductase
MTADRTEVVIVGAGPTGLLLAGISPQYHTERLLERRARSLGARIVGGTEVTGLSQDAEGVQVRARGAGGAAATYRASYVVGADGMRSAVRTALGLPFPGRSVMRSVMLADVRLSRLPPDMLTVNATEAGFAFIVPFGDGWYRAIAWNRHHQLPDTERADLEEIRQITRQALGSDFGMHDPGGCPGSTTTSARSRPTGQAGSSWPATPHTCIPRPVARA